MIRSRLPSGDWPGHARRASSSFTIATGGEPGRSAGVKSRPASSGIPMVGRSRRVTGCIAWSAGRRRRAGPGPSGRYVRRAPSCRSAASSPAAPPTGCPAPRGSAPAPASANCAILCRPLYFARGEPELRGEQAVGRRSRRLRLQPAKLRVRSPAPTSSTMQSASCTATKSWRTSPCRRRRRRGRVWSASATSVRVAVARRHRAEEETRARR